MKKLLLLALLTVSGSAFAQNVGIGTNKPDESAILDLKSSNKGFLLPRLTEKQKGLIPQPAEGLMIYQTDASQGVYLYQGGNWKNIGNTNVTTTGTTANATNAYTANYLLVGDGTSTPVSSSVYVNPSNGNVGIGTNNTSALLTLSGPKSELQIKNGDSNTLVFGGFVDGRQFIKSINLGVDFTPISFQASSFNFETGNVGIGVIYPLRPLHIKKTNAEILLESVGNSSSFEIGAGNINFLRGLQNNDFAIFTNNSERFRIKNNGLVGIGTNSPTALLTLSAPNAELHIKNGDSNTLVFGNFNNGAQYIKSINLGVDFTPINFQASRFIFEKGKVGIGTINPNQELDVIGSIQQSNVKSSLLKADATGKLVAAMPGTDFVGIGTSSAGSIAKFTATGIVANSALTEVAITNGTGVKLDSKSAGYLAVGDFGAGTPMSIPAGYRLVVQDGIITEKVKVAVRNQTDWADYVFEPNYSLMPLNEVEQFVKENKHLPNVPSAEEMVEKGVEVGQTSKMFMEKIEELTLYLIELKKEIDALKAENFRLKK